MICSPDLLLTFKCIEGSPPEYLCLLIHPYGPAPSLWSENHHLLQGGNPWTKKYGECVFQHCAPKLWKSLPNHLRCIQEVNSFKNLL